MSTTAAQRIANAISQTLLFMPLPISRIISEYAAAPALLCVLNPNAGTLYCYSHPAGQWTTIKFKINEEFAEIRGARLGACAAGRLFLVNEAETPSYRDYTGFQYFQPARSAVHLLDFSAVAKAAEQRKPQKLTVQKLQSLQSRNPSVSSIAVERDGKAMYLLTQEVGVLKLGPEINDGRPVMFSASGGLGGAAKSFLQADSLYHLSSRWTYDRIVFLPDKPGSCGSYNSGCLTPSHKRTGFEMCSHNEFIFVVGGYGENYAPTGFCNVYNERTHSWQELPRLNVYRFDVLLCVHQSCLFAIGGRTRLDYSSTPSSSVADVEWLDLTPLLSGLGVEKLGRWQHEKKLNLPIAASSGRSISNEQNVVFAFDVQNLDEEVLGACLPGPVTVTASSEKS